MAKKPDAWMPLYFGAYLTDTMHLTTEQHGAYLLLLMAAWKRGGGLPDDDAQLAAISRLTPQAWARSRSVIAAFWTIGDGEWRQKRLGSELQKARKLVDQKIAAGVASANKRWGNGRCNEQGNETGNENVTSVTTDAVTGCTTDAQRLDTPLPIPITSKSKALSGKPDVKAVAIDILDFLNRKTNHAYRPVPANLKLIEARLKEGFTPDDIRAVIVAKAREWGGNEEMAYCLRPKTLFGATNFANYEGQLPQVTHEAA